MKVVFQGDNGTSRLILTPETARDSSYIALCREFTAIRTEAGKPDVLVIVFENAKAPQ